jgi:hypothetical protein
MNNTKRNIIAVIVGWLVGSVVNMSIINLGNSILPIDGIDMSNMEELSNAYLSLDIEYFITPFLAHALGTLVGAIIATIIAKGNKKLMALIVGGIFLIGGIMVSFMINSPIWFIVVDLVLAYIPMALLGYLIGLKFSK